MNEKTRPPYGPPPPPPNEYEYRGPQPGGWLDRLLLRFGFDVWKEDRPSPHPTLEQDEWAANDALYRADPDFAREMGIGE